MVNKIYNQVCMEKYLDNMAARPDCNFLLDSAIETDANQWEEIIEDLKELYPYAAESMDFTDFINNFTMNIPEPEYMKDNKAIIRYIQDFAFEIADCVVSYLMAVNRIIEKNVNEGHKNFENFINKPADQDDLK